MTRCTLQGAKGISDIAHELCMHLRCAGPHTVKILSVGMDKIPRGPVLSANAVCFSMELASQSLKDYIRSVILLIFFLFLAVSIFFFLACGVFVLFFCACCSSSFAAFVLVGNPLLLLNC